MGVDGDISPGVRPFGNDIVEVISVLKICCKLGDIDDIFFLSDFQWVSAQEDSGRHDGGEYAGTILRSSRVSINPWYVI